MKKSNTKEWFVIIKFNVYAIIFLNVSIDKKISLCFTYTEIFIEIRIFGLSKFPCKIINENLMLQIFLMGNSFFF